MKYKKQLQFMAKWFLTFPIQAGLIWLFLSVLAAACVEPANEQIMTKAWAALLWVNAFFAVLFTAPRLAAQKETA